MAGVRCEIDHVTVTAPTLESGADFVRRALGAEMRAGGEHPRMGTHNLLLRLGDGAFLEVIAPNPAAPRPDRPRWFALDDPATLRAPRLATWVARTDDLRACPADVRAVLGAVEVMTRGAREWLITIPADGSLPMGGAAPALIEWQVPRRLAALDMPASGCALSTLTVGHPEPGRVSTLLAALGLDGVVRVVASTANEAARLVAEIETPQGRRTLGG